MNKLEGAISHIVAKKWGVYAPFPRAALIDRYIKHTQFSQLVKVYESDLEHARRFVPRDIGCLEKSVAAMVRRRDRLKLPSPFQSWEHIGDFHSDWALKAANKALWQAETA
jgi:hypothetical protein